ncbi:MAG: N-acetylmuramoyl-L-alanine amidase [Vicinamibacterales bacterium]|nr:N-acetylmuramoyl-L-alanine amidase [Vicinamibacterales bacterium]
MPSFVRLIALALFFGCAVAPQAFAQSMAAIQYGSALEQERLVSASPAAAASDFRFVVSKYWRLVRRHPSSGYADNALWQAGNLSMEAFRRFSDDRDRQRSVQLFQWLRDQYPHSSMLARASSQLEQLSVPQVAAETTIRAVHREVLPEVVRITVEMDREVPFYQERLAGPARLFFDLKGTKTVAALQDAALRYDGDVVREIRFGRHPNSTTRIVVDVEDVGRYSVFTLYDPYRIVIDCERGHSAPVSTVAAVTPLAEAPVARPAPPIPPAPLPDPSIGKPVAPAVNSGGQFSVARQLGLGASRIVIDPGHGGHDPGATAFTISEAELVLDIALRLEKLLQQQPGVEVTLTRRTNDFLGLEERTDFANRESADLFLSIHANASANATARGVETYFLNFALNRQAEVVAARENAASGKTMNSLPGIIKAITLNNKLNESRDFAASIQRSLVRGLTPSNRDLKDLGVKQAPFMVLIGASMPSVLAEISFVTNRQEARLLKTPAYRDKIAESLLAGILRYQQALKKVQTAALR